MPRGGGDHTILRWQERKDAEATTAERAVMVKVKRRMVKLEGQRFVAYDADSLIEATSHHGRPGHLW